MSRSRPTPGNSGSLGHEKLETTAIYTQVSIEQLKDVHRRTHPAEKPKKPDSQNDEEPLS